MAEPKGELVGSPVHEKRLRALLRDVSSVSPEELARRQAEYEQGRVTSGAKKRGHKTKNAPHE
jgi:hypothetical protein